MPPSGQSASLQPNPSPSKERHRGHPAHRLQHSPSLPDIWFTSSQPSQSAMVQADKISKDGPSSLPSPQFDTAEFVEDKDKDKESRPHHVKYASVSPASRISIQGSKAHARRRTERDQPHALLTPPLTPSSSIRTTTSDSVSTAAKGPFEVGGDDTNVKNPLENFAGLTISEAGAQSNIRQRFNFLGASEISPGKDEQQPAQEGPRSPPFLYTTPTVNTVNRGGYQQLDPGQLIAPMGSIHPPTPALPLQMGFGYGVNIRDHNVQYPMSENPPTCYTPDGICSYCPSRTPVMNCSPYVLPCPSPIPAYYPAQVNPSVLQNVVNVGPFPPVPCLFPYEYMEPPSHPLPSVPHWAFDPAIAAVGPGPNHLVPIVALHGPPPPSHFIREEVAIPVPQFRPLAQGPIREQEFLCESSPGPFAHISTPSTPESSPKGGPSTSTFNYDTYDPSASCDDTVANEIGLGISNERNQLSLARIKAGDDLRTTVMIKNIPNKMSDVDLTDYINKVCPRRIDFLYLRMDFKNGCNVGYAFVNFMTVQDLAHFVEKSLGTKWNMFSSEKILQMSYANFQGKEALIEKFKNSAIMDEREAWRPRIFYTSGKNQGLPEPFPVPTHIRRKERSSYNRGTLYPPGANSSHRLLNNIQRRYNGDNQLFLQNRSNNERIPGRVRNGQLEPIDVIGGTSQRWRGGGGIVGNR